MIEKVSSTRCTLQQSYDLFYIKKLPKKTPKKHQKHFSYDFKLTYNQTNCIYLVTGSNLNKKNVPQRECKTKQE